MERRGKRLREIQLPEAIIQDVQSRLSIKEAAQTAAVSKSWNTAWLTRADVVLDYRHFIQRKPDRFPELARKRMQRYEELNLRIDTFKLCLKSGDGDRCSVAGELVQKAIEFGAIDIDVEFMSKGDVKKKFVFPVEVLGSGKLVRLSLKGSKCLIDLGGDGSVVNCSGLKSLDLCRMYARGDAIQKLIVSSCPLIEDLRLSECLLLNYQHRFLDLGQGFGAQCVFQNLTNLMLSRVKVHHLFFRDFSSAFPRLRDLTLSHCLGGKMIRISSHSLECITVDQIIKFRARIEVPNLRVFTCSTGYIPSVSIITVSGQWESRIYTRCSKGLNLGWFLPLKLFLRAMKGSKCSFHLSFLGSSECTFNARYVTIKPRPELDDLTIPSSCLGSSEFWNGLLWRCRPLLITVYWCSGYEESLEKFVSSRLKKLGEDYIPKKSVFGQSYLKEVKVEVFDESVAADHWEPVTWKTLLDASTVAGAEHKFRFHCRWKYSADRPSTHRKKSIN